MKRSRSFDSAWQLAIARPVKRIPVSAPPPATDFDGIIDSAIATLQTATVTAAATAALPVLPKLTLPYDAHSPTALTTSQCLTPQLTTSANAFEDMSVPHKQQQQQQQPPFEKLAAEIDHILSPLTHASAAPPQHLSEHDISAILTIPPLPASVVQNRPQSSVHAKGKAMQEILNAIAAPTAPPSFSSRRSSSSAPTQCHVCGKTYTESSNLSKHIRTVHLKLRPFRCHLCSSSFAEKNKLGKHIQSVHEHARPYKCELCSATFSQASDRKRHRLVLHEGRRPFTCVYCEKAFGRRSSLTQHCSRVHKNENPPNAPVRTSV